MDSDVNDQPVVAAKVVAGSIAGGVTIICIWAMRQFAHVEVPGEVASAFTTVCSGLAAYLKKS